MAHIDWVDDHALAYRTALMGALSGDPEVRAIVEALRGLERIARGSGFTSVTPWLQIALQGWVAFLEGACLAWLDTGATTKDELVRLIASLLPAAIKAAADQPICPLDEAWGRC